VRLVRQLSSIVVAAGLAAGCSTPVAPDDSIPVVTIAQSDSSAIGAETTFVIRSNAELGAAWSQIYADRLDRTLPPQIDFDTYMLVIVASGRQPSSGFTVKITGATRDRDGLVVHVTIERPGENCGTATVITGPIAIARLPKLDRPVRFDITRTSVPCR
jgi:protease stability complex PrcB-like protein